MKTSSLFAATILALTGTTPGLADESAQFRCYGLDGHDAKTVEIRSSEYVELGNHEGNAIRAKLAEGVVSVMVVQESPKAGIFFVSPIDRIVYRTMGSKSTGTLLNCINLSID